MQKALFKAKCATRDQLLNTERGGLLQKVPFPGARGRSWCALPARLTPPRGSCERHYPKGKLQTPSGCCVKVTLGPVWTALHAV